MADDRPQGINDDEWQAILAHRKATRPARKGFLRGKDEESGADFEIELTPEEADKLIGRHAKLFSDDKGSGAGGDSGKDDKPAALKDYFRGGKRSTGTGS